jgi:hypothetical protein
MGGFKIWNKACSRWEIIITENDISPAAIGALPSATDLTGTELIQTVQGGIFVTATPEQIKTYVNLNSANVWGYVNAYANLPLGITATDPEIGDLVGVNTTTGVWIIGTQRRMGFYKRSALTGVVATDYGTQPYTDFSPVDITTSTDTNLTGIISGDGSKILVATSPTIGNFTNAQHNHTSASTGGVVTAGITNIVEDTTPQLGGNLDTQGNLIIGGTAVGSLLSLKSTTANGTLTAKGFNVLVGNNGGTEAITVLNNGLVGIGNIAPALYLQGPSAVATPFTIGAGTPAQVAGGTTGNNLTLSASNAVAGSSTGSPKGGDVQITAGNGAYKTDLSPWGNGGSIGLTGGTGANMGYSSGGAINIVGGTTLSTFFASGGSVNITGGGPVSSTGSVGGHINLTSGIGITSGNINITVSNSYAVGALTLKGGKSTNTAGALVGGPVYIITQDGASCDTVSIAGNGGLITTTLGPGGPSSNNTTGTGGNGGAYTVNGGVGGNVTGAGGTHLGGNGSTFTFTSGAGGNATGASGTRTGGNSGNITLDIGTAGTGATANGTIGNILLVPTRGKVGIGIVPTAVLQLKAGTASAGTAPLKFTSGTLNTAAEAGAIEFLIDAFYGTITTGAVRSVFSFIENSPHLINKVASANVRNSHDAEATSTSATYVKVKTITLSKGLIGQQRFLFDIKTSNAGVDVAYGKIYRNGVALGTEQSDTTGSYVTKSEDLTQTWLPNDTCELWVKIANASTVSVQNFRIDYDDSPTVTVTSVNS